jgi:hypothetical protein
MSPKRFIARLTVCALLLAGAPLLPRPALLPAIPAAHASTVTLAKATYYDKTLAGILGEVAGVLTGYEFVPDTNPDGTPMSPLPDNWFGMVNGPYSGLNTSCGPYPQPWCGNLSYPNYVRLHGTGVVGSYDSYHIDFFNQLILHDRGVNPSAKDIRDEWTSHGVSDWGGGWGAVTLMNQGVLPPFTGKSEWQYYSWETEPYLENDTLGMDAPGMPLVTSSLLDKFGQVQGEGDGPIWAKFLATMESLAYVNTDVHAVLEQASAVLPENSWPYQIYLRAKELYTQHPTDWHPSVQELVKYRRMVYGQDNAQAIPDINNGFLILALLYGNGDYQTTAKITALTNYDAEDQTGAAGAILGIMGGMAGLPQAVKNIVYANGNGVYQNDAPGTQYAFQPHITNNYPYQQKWTDLASLYQSNAEAQIQANGGSIDANNYYLPGQSVTPIAAAPIYNADFEQGDLSGWSTWTPVADTTHIYAQQTTNAHTGNWQGDVTADSAIPEGKLYVTLNGLVPGATYRATAYLMAAPNQEARLYVDNYGGPYIYTSVFSQTMIAPPDNPNLAHPASIGRSITFVPQGTTATVGLHVPPGAGGTSAIDDLHVEQVTNPASTRYEAENATVSGGQVRTPSSASNSGYVGGLNNVGSYAKFQNVNVPTTGEYRVSVNFANGWSDTSRLNLYANGSLYCTLPIPKTGSWGTFSRNILEVPVVLQAGSNTIQVQKDDPNGNYAELDYIDVSAFPAPIYQNNLLTNPGFEVGGTGTQTPPGWATWPGSAGTDADADYTETGGYFGTYRLTHYKASSYEAYTSQTVTNIPNGNYVAKAWVSSGSVATDTMYMDAKGFDSGGSHLYANVPNTGSSNWTAINIPNIQVTNGQATIGFYSKAGGGDWMSVDNVELYAEPSSAHNATLLANAGFEGNAATQTPSSWDTWPGAAGTDANADYTEGGGYAGAYRLTHYKATSYEVYTSQTMANIPNGTYTLSAYVVGSGAQTDSVYMDAKNFDGNGSHPIANVQLNGWPNWTQIRISSIQVTNGQCTVGFYSKANGGDFMSVDSVQFYRTS